jgi:hypothetical protein
MAGAQTLDNSLKRRVRRQGFQFRILGKALGTFQAAVHCLFDGLDGRFLIARTNAGFGQ